MFTVLTSVCSESGVNAAYIYTNMFSYVICISIKNITPVLILILKYWVDQIESVQATIKIIMDGS